MKKIKRFLSLIVAINVLYTAMMSVHANDFYSETRQENNFDIVYLNEDDELQVRGACACHTYETKIIRDGVCQTCQKSSTYVTVVRCSRCGAGYISFECGHKIGIAAD